MKKAPRGEEGSVARSGEPVTRASIACDLRALGLEEGVTVIVHSALSALGWVCGGPQALVEALVDVVGEAGTLVMPTHSSMNSDPARWENPAVPPSWWPIIREQMPAFDPNLTPTRGMGATVECFRRLPDARRSAHPEVSFAAWGRHRDFVVGSHTLDHGLGEGSPLARIYDLDAEVLLLGVSHARNTSLHLAEYRSDWSSDQEMTCGAAVRVEGERQWVSYDDIGNDVSDFARIGAAFAGQSRALRRGKVGLADAQLMPQRALVDFAVGWIDRFREEE